MIIRFRAANFRSLRDESELSFVAAGTRESDSCLIDAPAIDGALLPAVGLYGSNASGKSNVLQALHFMEMAVVDSQRRWDANGGVPVEPFALDEAYKAQPSRFEVDLILEGTRYTYGFEATEKKITREWLNAYPTGHLQRWFVRDSEAKSEFKFSRLLGGENQTIQRLTRPNSLFLSAAAQNNHEALKPIYQWFWSGLYFLSDRHNSTTTLRMIEEGKNREGITELLHMADLGVTDVDFSREPMPEFSVDVLQALAAKNPEIAASIKQREMTIPRVRLRHSTGAERESVLLPFESESLGTRALFSLAGPIMRSLATGGTLLLDELDASLHPLLSQAVLQLYCHRKSNPYGAQLLFNTHDTNLLDSSSLRRDQIWFTEKNHEGATQLYPLTDFRARKQENLKRGYLQGRFGAIPFLGAPNRLATMLGNDE